MIDAVLSKVWSATVLGVEGQPIEVEVDIAPGLPGMSIVGLPDAAVQESRERVRSAIRHSGFEYPLRRITVNLAPASLRKGGAAYDLAIAVGILCASGQLPSDGARGSLLLGELALDGRLRPVRGVMPMVADVGKRGFDRVVVPAASAPEARVSSCVSVVAAHSLAGVAAALRGSVPPAPGLDDAPEDSLASGPLGASRCRPEEALDLTDVSGQAMARRALEVAAAGEHNLLFVGPPGSGKTMLAARLPAILPPLDPDEAVEVARIQSVVQSHPSGSGLPAVRPFRSVHHSASCAALVGGGPSARPGEVSMAHRGVLFLDELPEFRREVLEALRQPLEDACVTIARAQAVLRYPAAFLLAAAMNPCACGFLGDAGRRCTCSAISLERYRQRLSGPLLDRFDLHVEVPRLPLDHILATAPGVGAPSEASATVRARVIGARAIQSARLAGQPHRTNGRMGPSQVKIHCRLAPSERSYLQRSAPATGLSARGLSKVLKVARTIADLAGAVAIERPHLAEALGYRALDLDRPCAQAA